MNPFLYSIWLMPCAVQRAALEEAVRRLAVRFGTPLFAPHATLCSGVWNGPEAELAAAVNRLSSELPVELAADGIGWTDCWSAFFFLRLRGGDDLFVRSAEQVAGSHPPAAGPHVSLLYNPGRAAMDREAMRGGLEGTLPERVRFDSLVLVRPATGRWEDVGSWEFL
jgi:hypothetical protein